MVKSPLSTGSKDVIKLKMIKNYLTCNLLTKKYEPTCLIEEYLDGPQYLVETVVVDGNIHFIAILEQEITQFKRFIITGYNVLNKTDKVLLQNIQQAVKSIVKSFEMETGTSI